MAGCQALVKGAFGERSVNMAFKVVAKIADLKANGIVAAESDGQKIALYLVDGHPMATSDVCTHEQCPLSEEGEVSDGEVACLCHGSRFEIRTGKVLQGPATVALPTYSVTVRGQDILVDLS